MSLSDLEQKQMVKAWVKEYGYYILFSVVFFLAANFGWRYWQQQKITKIESATFMYSQMMEASEEDRKEEANLYAEKLIKDYSDSIYASFASLMLAKDYAEKDNLESAEEKLRFVIKNSPAADIEDLARFRLARILIDMKEPQKALDLLPADYDGVFVVEYSEVRGDAFSALDKKEDAEKEYKNAMTLSGSKKIKPPLLELKLQQF